MKQKQKKSFQFIIKKNSFLLLSLMMGLFLLSGCGNYESQESGTKRSSEKPASPRIVTTIFPEYDWVREILGDQAKEAEFINLFDKGVDIHSFQPTANDMKEISDCDLFIYVGGESDKWVEEALKNKSNPRRKVIRLMDLLSEQLQKEEPIEGVKEEKEEEDAEDEHVWLSLKNAQKIIPPLAEALEELFPQQKNQLQKNAEAYLEKLKALDQEYEKITQKGKRKTLLFGDRFPFLYLTKDYGLKYYAAFSGCSAETEASFERVSFLAGKVNEQNLPFILTIEGSDQKLAKTIIENTANKDQKISCMNSMQSIHREEIEKGISYLKIMEENGKVLQKALN